MSERTVIEFRNGRSLEQIGTCLVPIFTDEVVILPSATIVLPPAFRLKEPDIVDWLSRKLLFVTRISERPTGVSTASWTCRYKSCAYFTSVEGVHVFTNLMLDL